VVIAKSLDFKGNFRAAFSVREVSADLLNARDFVKPETPGIPAFPDVVS
jgi:hypothetical protein